MTSNYLAPSIPDVVNWQLPEVVRSPANSQFVKFLTYYYDWLVQKGQPTDFIKNLIQYRDIDTTTDAFRQHITKALLASVPPTSKVNRTVLTKQIATFLKSKGSFESFRFIMNAIYGEDIEQVWNSKKLFRASSNDYTRTATVVIETVGVWANVEGAFITQTLPTPASAVIASCTNTSLSNVDLAWLELDPATVIGTFVVDGVVQVLNNNVNRSWYQVTDYCAPISFENNIATVTFDKEIGVPYDGLILKQTGSDFRAVISTLISRNQGSSQTTLVLRTVSSTGTFVPGKTMFIIAPALENISYTTDDFQYGSVSSSVLDIALSNPGSLYSHGDPITFIGGSGENVSGYVAEVTSGGVETVTVLQKGYGYSIGDQLISSEENSGGQGCTAYVSAIDGSNGAISLTTALNSVYIVNGGSGYAVGDILEIAPGPTIPHTTTQGMPVAGSTPARLRVNSIASAWSLQGINIAASGLWYPAYTTIALVNANNLTLVSGFSATPVIGGFGSIVGINITGYPTNSTLAALNTSNYVVTANGYGASVTGTLSGNSLTGYSIVHAGVNYKDPVVIITGNGTGAVAYATTSGGAISAINIVSGGSGYTTITLTIAERNGLGFVAVPLLQNPLTNKGSIASFTISVPGNYATVPPCFEVRPINRSGSMTGTGAIISLDFKVNTATVTNSGSFYHSVATALSGYGSGATFLPQIFNGVISAPSCFNIISGGTGYTHATLIVGGGAGFECQLSISGGSINGMVILSGGVNYSPGAGITIIGDGTSANISLTSVQNGVIGSIAVLNGGSNYYYGTSISIGLPSTSGGIPASISPVVVNGVIKSVNLSVKGSGYTQSDLSSLSVNSGIAPTLTTTLSGVGGIINYSPINSGSGYLPQTGILGIAPLSFVFGVAGSGAVLLPTLDANGTISSILVLDGGTGFTQSSTISVSGGGAGWGASLIPVQINGMLKSVTIVSGGQQYQQGTYALILGDGINAAITPIVETGITSVNLLSPILTGPITIADPTGTGAEVSSTTVNGYITSVALVEKGSGYSNPSILVAGVVNPYLTIAADGHISSLSITNKGSEYTYAECVIVGDGQDAKFTLSLDVMGAIVSSAVNVAGTGITSTPFVTVTDPSGFGAVAAVTVTNQGAGYKTTPILSLPDKYNNTGVLIGTGTKFQSFGSQIGAVSKVAFTDHGAFYEYSPPTPVFPIVASLTQNAPFTPGETVIAKVGNYASVVSTSNILLENGNILTDEIGEHIIADGTGLTNDGTAVVISVDYDRNLIKLDAPSDVFLFSTEDGTHTLTSQDNIAVIDERSSSFKQGDTLVGLKSGAEATINYMSRASGAAVLGGNGWSEFKFNNDVGMLNNSQSVIADNQRYQDYAYVIKAGLALQQYEQLLEDTCHPAGYMMFGDVVTHTMVNSQMLDYIGNNITSVIVYVLSVYAMSYNNVQYTPLYALYGDYAKFDFKYQPISKIIDYSIFETSNQVMGEYVEYRANPLFDQNVELWSIINSCNVGLSSTDVAADGTPTLYTLEDNNATYISGIQNIVTCNNGDILTFEMFIVKETNPQFFPKILLGDSWIYLNLQTGTYLKSGNVVLDFIDMGNYWFVRINAIATSTSVVCAIYPAYGKMTNYGVADITATGSISVSQVTVKNVTGSVSYSSKLRAVYSGYAGTFLQNSGTEADINILTTFQRSAVFARGSVGTVTVGHYLTGVSSAASARGVNSLGDTDYITAVSATGNAGTFGVVISNDTKVLTGVSSITNINSPTTLVSHTTTGSSITGTATTPSASNVKSLTGNTSNSITNSPH